MFERPTTWTWCSSPSGAVLHWRSCGIPQRYAPAVVAWDCVRASLCFLFLRPLSVEWWLDSTCRAAKSAFDRQRIRENGTIYDLDVKKGCVSWSPHLKKHKLWMFFFAKVSVLKNEVISVTARGCGWWTWPGAQASKLRKALPEDDRDLAPVQKSCMLHFSKRSHFCSTWANVSRLNWEMKTHNMKVNKNDLKTSLAQYSCFATMLSRWRDREALQSWASDHEAASHPMKEPVTIWKMYQRKLAEMFCFFLRPEPTSSPREPRRPRDLSSERDRRDRRNEDLDRAMEKTEAQARVGIGDPVDWSSWVVTSLGCSLGFLEFLELGGMLKGWQVSIWFHFPHQARKTSSE